MQYELLKELVNKNLSIRKIAAQIGASYSNIRYWLKKYKLTTKARKKKVLRPCRICDKQTLKTRCATCETKIRRYRCKLAAVKLKGGCCSRCGWTGNIGAFEFHHRDPKEKFFVIGGATNKSWAKILVELQKCDLVCANCHRIEHSPVFDNPKFIMELARYGKGVYNVEVFKV